MGSIAMVVKISFGTENLEKARKILKANGFENARECNAEDCIEIDLPEGREKTKDFIKHHCDKKGFIITKQEG